MRYTEYHAGKAVIKDRSLLAEAMEKLAKYFLVSINQRIVKFFCYFFGFKNSRELRKVPEPIYTPHINATFRFLLKI